MKAIIEFDLDNPDDVKSHRMFINARNAYNILWDISQKLRDCRKYDHEFELESFTQSFYNLLEENNIDLDD